MEKNEGKKFNERQVALPEGLGGCVSRLDSAPPSRSVLMIPDVSSFAKYFASFQSHKMIEIDTHKKYSKKNHPDKNHPDP